MTNTKAAPNYPSIVTVAHGSVSVRLSEVLSAVVAKGESFKLDPELYRDREGTLPAWLGLIRDPDAQVELWGEVRFLEGTLEDNPRLLGEVEFEKAQEAERQRRWKIQHGGGLRRLERDGVL